MNLREWWSVEEFAQCCSALRYALTRARGDRCLEFRRPGEGPLAPTYPVTEVHGTFQSRIQYRLVPGAQVPEYLRPWVPATPGDSPADRLRRGEVVEMTKLADAEFDAVRAAWLSAPAGSRQYSAEKTGGFVSANVNLRRFRDHPPPRGWYLRLRGPATTPPTPEPKQPETQEPKEPKMSNPIPTVRIAAILDYPGFLSSPAPVDKLAIGTIADAIRQMKAEIEAAEKLNDGVGLDALKKEIADRKAVLADLVAAVNALPPKA